MSSAAVANTKVLAFDNQENDDDENIKYATKIKAIL